MGWRADPSDQVSKESMPQREMGFRPYSRVYPSEEVVKLFPIGCLYPAQPDERPNGFCAWTQQRGKNRINRIRQNFVAEELLKRKNFRPGLRAWNLSSFITEQEAMKSVRAILSQEISLYYRWAIERSRYQLHSLMSRDQF